MESRQHTGIFNQELNKLISLAKELTELEVLYCGEISAGFTSEAYNCMDEGIDFNRFIALEHASIYELYASDGQCSKTINKKINVK